MNARELARAVADQLRDVCADDADFEAELLVRHASRLDRVRFFSGAPACNEEVQELIERRLRGEPLAYITGTREFYGLPFRVTPAVLIPRPESELLVDIALRELKARPGATVTDIGTGSGCIAIAIAASRIDEGRTVMLDRSVEALAVANDNARALGANCEPILSDLAGALRTADIVTANLPYISTPEVPSLQPEIRDWEPRLAVDGGRDGLDLIARLVTDCAHRLRPRLLVLEVAAGQALAVRTLLESNGATSIETYSDLAGFERAVAGRWDRR